jgi:hypothetical protein
MDYTTVKTWLTCHCHQIIRPDNQKDFDLMNDVLRCHPNWSNWKYKCVEYFRITRSAKKKALQVYIKVSGVSKERLVSWVACTTKKRSSQNTLAQAMRSAIRDQTQLWSNSQMGTRKCALCEKRDNLEVDHHPTKFRDIKKDFLDFLESLDTQDVKVYWNLGQYHLKDDQIKASWSCFHLKKAQYRFLCSTCNQKTH